jgi:hypothetical protein
MGLSRRASIAYGRAASGSHLSTHDTGGSGGGPSSLSLSLSAYREEVESGCEKLIGSKILST